MKEKKWTILTEEQDILLSCWEQWAYPTKRGRWSGGLSTLESIESYFKDKKIINRLGNFNKNDFKRNPWL